MFVIADHIEHGLGLYYILDGSACLIYKAERPNQDLTNMLRDYNAKNALYLYVKLQVNGKNENVARSIVNHRFPNFSVPNDTVETREAVARAKELKNVADGEDSSLSNVFDYWDAVEVAAAVYRASAGLNNRQ